MRRVILKAALLLAPIGLLLCFVDLRISQKYPSLYSAKRHLFQQQKERAEVLILGSSHSYYSVLPGEFQLPAFNLSAVSQSIYYDHALISKVLPEMPNLKLVIEPVSFYSLESELDEAEDQWRTFYYRHEWGLPHRNWRAAWSIRNYSAFFLYLPELGRGRMIFGNIRNVLQDFDEWGGWTNRPPPPEVVFSDGLEGAARASLKNHHEHMKPAHIPTNASLLVDMDRRLKARNAALAIITTPTANCYRNGMSPEAYRRMQQTLAALCASNGIPYFNYTGDKRFSDSDFWDSDHLTLEGAKKFSVILREEVESRLIAPRNAGSDAAWSKGKGRIPAQ